MRAALTAHEVGHVKRRGRAATNTQNATTGEAVKPHHSTVAVTMISTDATFIAGLLVLPVLTAARVRRAVGIRHGR